MGRTVRHTVRALAYEYASSSSCHGLPYVAQTHVSYTERICWLVCIVVSLTTCITAMVMGHLRWTEKPIIVSFSSQSIPVWQIPFPAITVCSQSRIRASSFNLTEAHKLYRRKKPLDREQLLNLRTISHVCSRIFRWNKFNESMEENIVPRMVNMSIKAGETFISCTWNYAGRFCSWIWHETLTEDGICFTFNMLPNREIFNEAEMHDEYRYSSSYISSHGWTMEDGYTSNEGLGTFPFRTAGSGIHAGAMVFIKIDRINRDFLCAGALQGFKIVLHTPDELPRVADQNIRISPFQKISIAVKPRMSVASKYLLKVPPRKRHCYFNGEKRLRFFRIYNQRNCGVECLSNFTLQQCGCVPFSMPRDRNSRVCDASEIDCYHDAAKKLIELDAQLSTYDGHCGCIPACTTIKYGLEISKDKLNYEALLMSLPHEANREIENYEPSVIEVYFKAKTFLGRELVEFMSFHKELASFGGLVALMSGMSITSLVEIFYFMVVRPLCQLIVAYRRKASGPVHPARPWVP